MYSQVTDAVKNPLQVPKPLIVAASNSFWGVARLHRSGRTRCPSLNSLPCSFVR